MKLMSEEDIYKCKKEKLHELVDKIKNLNQDREKEDARKRAIFNWKEIEKISINVWDEIESLNPEEEYDEMTIHGTTYAYVEMSETYNELDMNILLDVKEFLESDNRLPEGVDLQIKFYDSFLKYPILIEEHIKMLFTRWELRFSNISYEQLRLINESLEEYTSYQNNKVSIYSES